MAGRSTTGRWLLEDPDVNGAYGLATRWQDEHRVLEHDHLRARRPINRNMAAS
ncbi:hypothetical protein [Fodinicola feengrottensis]|uniref:hypothetical protein n=1 Tax=Fodinicola feengrottensis TaxID=435914 RepID=UPI0031D183B8